METKQLAAMKDKIKVLMKIVEKLKKGEEVADLEKSLVEGAEEPAEPEPPEAPAANDEDFEEPPDLPAD